MKPRGEHVTAWLTLERGAGEVDVLVDGYVLLSRWGGLDVDGLGATLEDGTEVWLAKAEEEEALEALKLKWVDHQRAIEGES